MVNPHDFKSTSYVSLFKDEFLRRKEKNSLYSLRAFANQLDLSPAYVSLVFRGKRHFSSAKALEVAKKLKWPREKQKYFISLLEFENPKTEESKESALATLQKLESSNLQFNSIDVDSFSAISIWYHNAILSLLTLVKSKATTKLIAKRFNLDQFETEGALRRLQRLGLVKLKMSSWSALYDYLRVPATPSAAIRLYHKELLNKAAVAIDEQDFDERDFSNMTLTVDRAQLQTAKKKITEFHNEMAQFLEGKNPTEVYQLSVQLFRLSQPAEKK
ncbi:MAG: DUF4423 domain-containing protein [Bdellovibrio sp.]|nr:DUF4423 domain-containing protein [Bdellovibrio sp.]